MPASSRGRHAMQEAVVLAVMPMICSRCATGWTRSPPRRVYSSGITPQTSVDGPSAGIDDFGAVAGPVQQRPTATAAAYDVRSGLMVSRPPLLTRELHPFESAFFFYQKRLAERLNTSFVTSIYYKRQTTRLMEWNVKVKERKGAVAKELGPYHGKGSRAWDDELRVGDPLSSQEHLLDSLLKDAETRVNDEAELIPTEDVVPVPRPMPRETEADRKNDVRRLDRKLDKTLYLVLKGRDGQWGFPVDLVAENENLHEGEAQAAQRILDQSAGVNMNTWIVGRTPIAHMVDKAVYSADGAVEKHGLKTFFLKARIMAGQANLVRNQLGYSDFKWLTRDELESELSSEYYRAVSKALSAR